jgi:hypothetical protein
VFPGRAGLQQQLQFQWLLAGTIAKRVYKALEYAAFARRTPTAVISNLHKNRKMNSVRIKARDDYTDH